MKRLVTLLTVISVIVGMLGIPTVYGIGEDEFGELNVTKTQNGGGYCVSTTGIAYSGSPYVFIAASYDANRLTGIETVNVPAPVQGTATTIEATFGATGAEETRFMLWSDLSGLKPVTKAKTITKQTDLDVIPAVELAQGQLTGGNSDLIGSPIANMVDGDEITYGQVFGNAQTNGRGNMYVDLGYKYKIAYVEIMSYSIVAPKRTGDFDIVLTNEIPDDTPVSENPDKELVAHVPVDNKFYVDYNQYPGEPEQQIAAANADGIELGYRAYFVPQEITDSYRYVSLEKLFDNDMGFQIQELKVYVLEEDIPQLTDAAHLKPGMGFGNQASETIGNINDGNQTSYFWLYNDSGYGCIDLGMAHKIAYIEVMSYSLVSPDRAGDFDIVLSNEIPNNTPVGENPNKELVAHVPVDGRYIVSDNAAGIALGYRKFGIPDDMADTSYKYVSFEKLGSSAGLQIQEVKVYVEEYVEPTYVEVAHGKGGGGSVQYDYTADKLTDGNETEASSSAFAWEGVTTGYMYIDLGMAYKIAYVEILAYSGGNYNRCGDFDISVSNQLPVANPGAADKQLLGHVPPATSASSSINVGYKRFYSSPTVAATPYQYISLEKFQANVNGLMVQEIKVYVLENDMPKFVNVASRIGGGGTDGSSFGGLMTNGNLSNYAYFLGTSGYSYIDLGLSYKISYIEILMYDNFERAGNFNLYLSNQKPVAGTGAADKMLVANVPTYSTAKDAATGLKTFTIPASIANTPFRYVALEKFTATSGLFVRDIKVYVNENDIPNVIEVAQGKNGGGSNLTGIALSMTDNNDGTAVSVTRNAGISGHAYIDLGAAYKIAYIEVLAYSGGSTLMARNFDVCLSNSIPDGTNSKVTIARPPHDSNAYTADVGYLRISNEANSNTAYQYVSFEKFHDANEGLVIEEVRVYAYEE